MTSLTHDLSLTRSIYAVAIANTADELVACIGQAVRQLGCEHFLLGLEVRKPMLQPVQHVASGYPLRWQQRYAEQGYIALDPTISYCQQHTTPLIWRDSLYKGPSTELLEEARSAGLAHGLSVGVHGVDATKSMISVARDRPFDGVAEQQGMVEATTVLAACAHVAAQRLIVPGLLKAQTRQLTPRERACLGFVMQGKSSSVISDLLRIAEPTVEFHVKNAMRKLGVATRLQAVAKAVALGLLE